MFAFLYILSMGPVPVLWQKRMSTMNVQRSK